MAGPCNPVADTSRPRVAGGLMPPRRGRALHSPPVVFLASHPPGPRQKPVLRRAVAAELTLFHLIRCGILVLLPDRLLVLKTRRCHLPDIAPGRRSDTCELQNLWKTDREQSVHSYAQGLSGTRLRHLLLQCKAHPARR